MAEDEEAAAARFHQNQVRLDRAFRRNLQQIFTIQETGGRGDCLYRAIAMGIGLGGSAEEIQLVRNQIADHLQGHQDEFTGFILPGNTIQNEIVSIRAPGVWGGNISLRVASLVYRRSIHVLQAPMVITSFDFPNPIGPPMYLSFHDANHYNFLEPNVDHPLEVIEQLNTVADEQDPEDARNQENFWFSQEVVDEGPTRNVMDIKSAFISAKWDMRGRCHAFLIMLIPRVDNEDYENAKEMIEETTPKQIYILVDYWGKHSKLLLSNNYAEHGFKCFQYKIVMPLKSQDQKWGIWMSSVIVTHIILGTMRFQWREMEIIPLFLYSKRSLPVCLLDSMWPTMKERILGDVRNIINDPNSFLCTGCPDNCQFKGKYWHADAAYFMPLSFAQTGQNDFFERYNLYESVDTPNVKVMDVLRDIYRSRTTGHQDDLLPRIVTAIDINAADQALNMWCSYLVLIIDGTKMPMYKTTPVEDLIKKKCLRKLVYAGFTKNNFFRQTHFTDQNSRVYQALSTSTRIFWIRRYETNSENDGRDDEAKVIELLKLYLEFYWATNQLDKMPFSLLNIRSEMMRLISLEGWDEIDRFCADRIPVYRGQNPTNDNVHEGFFRGNYDLQEMQIPIGQYSSRNFANVRSFYDQVEMTRRL